MAEITKKEDHVAETLELLISFFQNADNIKKLLSLILEESNELEQTWYDLFAECTIDSSEGAQLDQWGVIVGQPRVDGLTDDEYRKLIEVRMETNRSEGEAVRIIDIAHKLLGYDDIWYRQRGRAHFSLIWEATVFITALWASVFIGIINDAIPAGVSWEAIEGEATTMFQFDTAGRGFDQGKLAGRVY